VGGEEGRKGPEYTNRQPTENSGLQEAICCSSLLVTDTAVLSALLSIFTSLQ